MRHKALVGCQILSSRITGDVKLQTPSGTEEHREMDNKVYERGQVESILWRELCGNGIMS